MGEIRNIFIANRGEIAVRIAKTAKLLGIRIVAPFTPDDAQSLHVKVVDNAVKLPDNDLSKSFLSPEMMTEMALKEGCDSIHPGYGFLSEDYRFAELCKKKKLKFIGPDPAVIKLMGDKSKARKIAIDSGVPVLPAFEGGLHELEELSPTFSYPVLLKAVSGGGGKGLRKVNSLSEFKTELERAEREALNYFGDGRSIVEPFINNARHIEIQILADNYGNVIHLFERECSIQRNHQKIIEESPALNITSELKHKLYEASIRIAKKVGYTNAGTIEFLVDKKEQFFFLEMNTRIQVEHGITEMVTEVDIVKEQIRIASGEKLGLVQNSLKQSGHAMEARIYAEDPTKEFRREPGCIGSLFFPETENIRIDTSLSDYSCIPDSFDPLLAKLIGFGGTRSDAITSLKQGLEEIRIPGIIHNIGYLKAILDLKEFSSIQHTTESLKNNDNQLTEHLLSEKDNSLHLALLAYLIIHFIKTEKESENIWQSIGYWRNVHEVEVKYDDKNYLLSWKKLRSTVEVIINDSLIQLDCFSVEKDEVRFSLNGNKCIINFKKENDSTLISAKGFIYKLRSNSILSEASTSKKSLREENNSGNTILSPLFGKVIKINYQVGQSVKKGEPLIILESMKMENNVLSPVNAIIKNIHVSLNENVKESQELIEFENISETKNKEIIFQN